MGIDLPDAESLNAKAKWNKLALEPSLKNIIFKEQQPDGFIFDFYNVKDKLYIAEEFTKYVIDRYCTINNETDMIKHMDFNSNFPNRRWNLGIQLNDEYEDGDLELKLSDDSIMKVEKGIGNTIVFLSDIEHRVTGVKNGNRYTLVNWVGLKKTNNYKKTLL